MESSSPICSIFVYGTLKRGQLREKQWPCKPIFIRPAYIRARLYDLGPYPAVTLGSDPVGGELWHFPEHLIGPTLAVLDVIEGYVPGRKNNLYERICTPVHSGPACLDEDPELAFLYQMDPAKLPLTAKRINPSKNQSVAISASPELAFARWPMDDAPPSVTAARPDPYPDDVVD